MSDFTEFQSQTSQIILIEASNRVLSQYPEELSIKAQEDLEQMGEKFPWKVIKPNYGKDTCKS